MVAGKKRGGRGGTSLKKRGGNVVRSKKLDGKEQASCFVPRR